MKLGQIGSASVPGNPPGTEAPAAGARQSSAAPATVQPAQVQAAVERINQALQKMGSDVKFKFDPAARESVIQVVDPGTNEVIRQIPSPDALAIAEALDGAQGLLVNERA